MPVIDKRRVRKPFKKKPYRPWDLASALRGPSEDTAENTAQDTLLDTSEDTTEDTYEDTSEDTPESSQRAGSSKPSASSNRQLGVLVSPSLPNKQARLLQLLISTQREAQTVDLLVNLRNASLAIGASYAYVRRAIAVLEAKGYLERSNTRRREGTFITMHEANCARFLDGLPPEKPIGTEDETTTESNSINRSRSRRGGEKKRTSQT